MVPDHLTKMQRPVSAGFCVSGLNNLARVYCGRDSMEGSSLWKYLSSRRQPVLGPETAKEEDPHDCADAGRVGHGCWDAHRRVRPGDNARGETHLEEVRERRT